MSAEAKEIIMTTAEEIGWFQERDTKILKARDIEIARALKANNVPIDVIIKGVPLSWQEVDAL